METTLDETPSRPQKSARVKLMDLLARRGHSELELREKLARHYPESEVEDAINHARERQWMAAPEDLSEAFVESLARRLKSHAYIERALSAKGLPAPARDPEIEIEKALKIAQTKIVRAAPLDEALQNDVRRGLGARGFDEDTIENVVTKLERNSNENEHGRSR